MDWVTIAVIAAVVVALCLFQFFTSAGSQANNGKISCMMPKTGYDAKGAKQKNERSLLEEEEEKPQEK